MGELTEARTACRICAVGCGTIVELDGDRVVRIKGDPDDPWSQGYTCSKGRAGPEFHHDPRRFDVPLMRTATGELVATTWDEALDDIAARLTAVVAEHGPAAVASYTGTGGPLDPSGYAVAQGFFRALGSSTMYSALERGLLGQVPRARADRRRAAAVLTRPADDRPAARHRHQHRALPRPWADDAEPARPPARPALARRPARRGRSSAIRDGPPRRPPHRRRARHRSGAAGVPRPPRARRRPRRSRVPRGVRRTRRRGPPARPGGPVHRRTGSRDLRRARRRPRVVGDDDHRGAPHRHRDRHRRVDGPIGEPHRVARVGARRGHRQPRPRGRLHVQPRLPARHRGCAARRSR